MTEFNSTLPIYIQIVNGIKKDISAGILTGGAKLPSVREFSERINVNPNTVQRAYQELEREQVTETRRGMGTFITENTNKLTDTRTEFAHTQVADFVHSMNEGGFCIHEIIEMLKNQEKEKGEK